VPQFLPAGHAVRGAQQVLGLGPVDVWQTGVAAGHVDPQLTVREPPQMASVDVTMPQFLPRRVQNAASPSAVQLQTPLALHTWPIPVQPGGQFAMLRVMPQLSAAVTGPHMRDRREHMAASVSGTQQVLAMDPVAGRHS
jgi:hypothetical protein